MPKYDARAYWRQNLRYLAFLLGIWFLVSFVAGILMVDTLNQWRIGGAKFGFWMAQQGSLFIFVFLIIAYIFLMNKLDKEHGVDE